MDKVKAVFIDVVSKTITDIEISTSIADIYDRLDCTTFDMICPKNAPRGLTIYIDDAGLLRDVPLGAFSVRGFDQVLSGHGLVVGTDDEGNTSDCPQTAAQIAINVRFEDTHYLPLPGFLVTPVS